MEYCAFLCASLDGFGEGLMEFKCLRHFTFSRHCLLICEECFVSSVLQALLQLRLSRLALYFGGGKFHSSIKGMKIMFRYDVNHNLEERFNCVYAHSCVSKLNLSM